MKNALLGGLLIISQMSMAQSEGPRSGGSFTTTPIAGSNKTWNSTSDAAPSDNLYTRFGDLTGGVGSYTDYLVASDFGFAIPTGVTINGILVSIECSDPNRKTSDYSIRIVKDKNVTGNELARGMLFPASDNYETYGGSTDLWGETWTPAQINDGGFGVAIAVQRSEAGGTTDGMIDDVRITVFYSYNTLPVTLLNFNADKKNSEVHLKWTTTAESQMDRYDVERSSNGRQFGLISSVNSRNQSQNTGYSAVDRQPLKGISYYRLKMIGKGGEISYSRIISVQSGAGNASILYPTQWIKGEPLHVINANQERLTVNFYNQAGQLLASTQTNNNLVSPSTSTWKHGLMHYQVIGEDGSRIGSGMLLVK